MQIQFLADSAVPAHVRTVHFSIHLVHLRVILLSRVGLVQVVQERHVLSSILKAVSFQARSIVDCPHLPLLSTFRLQRRVPSVDLVPTKASILPRMST